MDAIQVHTTLPPVLVFYKKVTGWNISLKDGVSASPCCTSAKS